MIPHTTLQMHSTVHDDATVTLSLERVPLAAPAQNEVVVRMQAAPINPSDLGNMFAGADTSTVRPESGEHGPGVRARMSPAAMRAAAARVGEPLPMGNEGAGVVVAAGSAPPAQALLGRTVALRAGSYTEYRVIDAEFCLVLPEGTTPAEAASCFVNPLTALGMVETLRAEGHRALVHTAAASNLGQMLVKICLADEVPLVNVVRKPEQAAVLRELGAEHVCDTSADDFDEQLTAACAATGATIGFDATGGGPLASRILSAMERALSAGAGFSRYGSTVHKQVYVYGSLQPGPVELHRTYGMAWGVGGWLLTNFLRAAGPEASQRLMARVAAEIGTTFASHYTQVVSMAEALDPKAIAIYDKRATGEKYLITPCQD